MGDNDVVRYADVGRPKPLAGEILVKVHAAGVNPVDWKVRDGAGQRMGMTLPIHLGSEVSGTVAGAWRERHKIRVRGCDLRKRQARRLRRIRDCSGL